MKFVLRELRVGDTLEGRIIELLAGDELLINFDGDLLRVANETRKPFKLGARVTLIVRAIQPLKFQLMPGRRAGHLDLSI